MRCVSLSAVDGFQRPALDVASPLARGLKLALGIGNVDMQYELLQGKLDD